MATHIVRRVLNVEACNALKVYERLDRIFIGRGCLNGHFQGSCECSPSLRTVLLLEMKKLNNQRIHNHLHTPCVQHLHAVSKRPLCAPDH